LRQVRNEIRPIRDRASRVSIAAGFARLTRLTVRHIPRGVCGVRVVNHPARVRTAALYANEYLDFYVKDQIVWFNPFEPKFAVAELAVQGRRGFDEVTHMQPPFVRHASYRIRGTLKGVPINVRFRRKPDALVWRGDCNKRQVFLAPKSGATKAMAAVSATASVASWKQ